MTAAGSRLARGLAMLPRPVKFGVLVAIDLGVFYMASIAAIALRYGDVSPSLNFSEGLESHFMITLLAPVVGVSLLAVMGVYSEVLRYSSSRLAGRIALACGLLTVLMLSSSFIIDRSGNQSRAVLIMLGILSFLGIWPVRVVAKLLLNIDGRAKSVKSLVYGAGVAGAGLAAALAADRRWSLIGFIDDNRRQQGRKVGGLRIYASGELPSLVQDLGIEAIFLALPSVGPKARKEILDRLRPLGVKILTVPTLEELIAGQAKVRDLRELDVEDLLGRQSVSADEHLVLDAISGKCVLVTGGGGSIGSELCRQIIAAAPSRLIVLDQSEFNLFQIENDLRSMSDAGSVEVKCVLGSVLDQALLDEVFTQDQVDVVFHAAAYKHVPIVEDNVATGVETNSIGTMMTVDTAVKHQVERFILVSTDKAVRPTSAMGASKRIAELIVQDRAARVGSSGRGTLIGIVRFGNVIGSSGSVVPFFKRQIEAGGPITVTHPEITRFFMTIPEAAELVIQTATMARGGDVFLLDMGDPVRILDLAKSLIELQGLRMKSPETPEGDIEIRITGLRPGEKIHEELLIGEDASPSEHPRIRRAVEERVDHESVQALISDLKVAVAARDTAALRQHLATYGDLKPQDRETTA